MIIEIELYSPRWGHKDTYTLTYNSDSLEVIGNTKRAKCIFPSNLNPQWEENENLNSILQNEHIYMPNILSDLLEHTWKEWKDGTSQEVIKESLKELEEWINKTTKAKPSSDFWNKYF